MHSVAGPPRVNSPTDKFDWLVTMRSGGAVTRFHTVRTLRPQTVATHSWGVLMALLAVGVGRGAVLAYAAMHDQHEQTTGDMRGDAKASNPALRAALAVSDEEFDSAYGISQLRDELTDFEVAAVNWADCYEGTQYCLEEIRMGNRYILPSLNNYLRAIDTAQRRLSGYLYGNAHTATHSSSSPNREVLEEVTRLNYHITNAAQPYI